MKSTIFRNDKHGLTERWFDVPTSKLKQKELPSYEREKLLKKDESLQIENSQRDTRKKSGWPNRRRSKER